MLPLNVSHAPPQKPPVVVEQAHKPLNGVVLRTLGECQLAVNPESFPKRFRGGTAAENPIDPDGAVANYVQDISGKPFHEYASHKAILKGPKHGILKPVQQKLPSGLMGMYYNYVPDSGYYGPDGATFEVTIDGKTVKVLEFLHVVHGVDTDDTDELCPHRYYKTAYKWKIASTDGAGSVQSSANLSASYTIQDQTAHFRIAHAPSAVYAFAGIGAEPAF
jgi:hypothetical protein